MLATLITIVPGRTDVLQVEAPTVKDCLVSWAGKVQAEGLTDDARTRLRGDMADFRPEGETLPGVWRLETDLGLGGERRATVVVVESARR